MKNLFTKPGSALLTVGLFLALCACESDGDSGIKVDSEVPEDVVNLKPCSTLYDSIIDMFPSSQDATENYPELFATTALKNITLETSSAVYVSYIAEEASYENSFGWYSYDSSNPPTSSSDIEWNIIFPHVSSEVLTAGDMVQLGDSEFAAGTTIGFFLIVQGWDGDEGVVRYKNKLVHFTDSELNKNNYQQHVLFKETQCDDIVLSFEDKQLDNSSDKDYNDIIFTISDNNEGLENTAFDLTDIVEY